MAELPSIPLTVPQVSAPRPSVSPSQIAQPYMELANALDKTAGAYDKTSDVLMKDVAVPAAEKAGLQAVTRDADGNIQVDKMPIAGDAAFAYQRAVKTAALADGESVARQDDIALRQQFHDDPQGYLSASEQYRKDKIDQYTKAAGPEVGISLGRVIGSQTTQTFKGLLNEKERLDLARASKSIDAGIASARDDAVAMARGGAAPDSPDMQQAFGKIEALTQEKVNNPRLAYPKEQAAYDLQNLQGELSANRFLHTVDQTYQNAPSRAEGARAALEQAKTILTDPNVKLEPQQRQQFYSRAVGEIHANEAIRRQDISEARAAESALSMQSALGMPVDPEQVEQVASAFKAAGDPGSVARLYGMFSRKPLNDAFGNQPLRDQVDQINGLRGAPRQQGAYQFFIDKGYSPVAAAGIVGGLRGETASLNTTQVHDGGAGLGISGWNGDRLRALNDYAKANGKSPFDLTTQLSFVDHELKGGTGDVGAAKAMSGLQNARTPEQAGSAMLDYFRPKNYDVPGAHPERASYARAAYDAFSGQPNPTSQLGATPAGSLWLQANRMHVVDKAANQAWTTIQKDWNEKQQRPPDDAIFQVISAARMSNDHGLLSQIDADMKRMDLVQDQAGRPLPEQQAAITKLHQEGNVGGLNPGQANVLHDLESRYKSITSGLENNPISTAVQNFPHQFETPAPLNLGDPAQLAAGLKLRGRIAQFAAENWKTGPVSALDAADLGQVKAAVEGPDVGAKAMVFGAISGLPEDVRNATLGKLAEAGGPNMSVSVAAGAMLQGAPDVGQSILRGQMALKTDKAFWPTGAEEHAATDEMNKALPPNAFGLAARTDPQGPFATAQGMVKARYADLSAQTGDVSGKLNKDRLTQSVNDVTGGVLSHNGAPLLAPARGMPQSDFDRILAGVNDGDLGNGARADNLAAATSALNLTSQEQALYQRHLTNLYGSGGVTNANGSRSTLFQTSFEEGGKTYNVPTVWDGKILPPQEAITRARQEGLDNFPSYGSEKEAEARYQQMHTFMDRDTGAYFKGGQAAVTTLNGAPITADYLRSSAQLESIGSGRYLVRLGKDPQHPTYAYQGANTEAPQKFVLDLRGKGVTPAGAAAYRAGLTQAGQVSP